MRKIFPTAPFGSTWPGPYHDLIHPDSIEHQNMQGYAKPESYCNCDHNLTLIDFLFFWKHPPGIEGQT